MSRIFGALNTASCGSWLLVCCHKRRKNLEKNYQKEDKHGRRVRESGRSCSGWRDLAIATVRYRVTQKYMGGFERDETTVRNQSFNRFTVGQDRQGAGK